LHRHCPDFRHAQLAQWETLPQTNRVKIAQLEHQVHPVPYRAKPATKERLMVKVVVLVAIVWNKRFKIKVPKHIVLLAQRVGYNQSKVPLPVLEYRVWYKLKIAKTRSI